MLTLAPHNKLMQTILIEASLDSTNIQSFWPVGVSLRKDDPEVPLLFI